MHCPFSAPNLEPPEFPRDVLFPEIGLDAFHVLSYPRGRLTPTFPDGPVFLCKVKDVERNWSEPIEVGVVATLIAKDAIVEVRLALEVRNALTGSVVVFRDGKDFFVVGFDFSLAHTSILAEGFCETVANRRLH
jgi:hypothetical protein